MSTGTSSSRSLTVVLTEATLGSGNKIMKALQNKHTIFYPVRHTWGNDSDTFGWSLAGVNAAVGTHPALEGFPLDSAFPQPWSTTMFPDTSTYQTGVYFFTTNKSDSMSHHVSTHKSIWARHRPWQSTVSWRNTHLLELFQCWIVTKTCGKTWD